MKRWCFSSLVEIVEGISEDIRQFGTIHGESVSGTDSNALGGAVSMVVEFVFHVYLGE